MKLSESEKKAIREAKAAYHRQWRKKNQNKVRQYNETYWLKKAAEMTRKEGDLDEKK